MLFEREETSRKAHKASKSKDLTAGGVIVNVNKENLAKYFVFSGLSLVLFALILLSFILYPVIREELNYSFSEDSSGYEVVLRKEKTVSEGGEFLAEGNLSGDTSGEEKTLEPVDLQFSIIVPKIKANARIIENVDPYNSQEYQQKLTQGVAHAKGSALPEELGNTFLFAHSSDNFYNANRYNAVFYLLNKMEFGDDFYIVRNNELYHYQVREKFFAQSGEVNYLAKDASMEQQATLMTCWPPGTTIKRLLVIGDLVSIEK